MRDRPWFDLAWQCWEAGSEPGRTEQDLADRFWTYLPFYFAEPADPVAAAHIDRIGREQRWHVPANDAWTGWRDTLDLRPHLAEVRCPTLIVTGEHDWICGPVCNRALASAIPGARYVEMQGVGHLPQYEAPAALRAIIDAWLTELDPAT